MTFRRVHKNESNLLVDMRIMYLCEDFKDTSNDQFDQIAENLPSY